METLLKLVNPFQLSDKTQTVLVIAGVGFIFYSLGNFMWGTASLISSLKKDIPENDIPENVAPLEEKKDTNSITSMHIDLSMLDEIIM